MDFNTFAIKLYEYNFYCYILMKCTIYFSDWLMLVAFISSIVTIIALHIWRKSTPINFILLGTFVSILRIYLRDVYA